MFPLRSYLTEPTERRKIMRITQVTRVSPDIDPDAALELSVGEYDDVTSDWYQADITSLHDELDAAGIKYLEYTLMRKALGDAANGLLVSVVTFGTLGAFELLKAWLPARQGRKVRVKFK